MKIIMIGDSTMHYNDATTYPQTGWGQMLPLFLKDDVKVCNFAMNGTSTKSFRDLGYFDKALECASSGDIAIIQFGHNDQKPEEARKTFPQTTYKENLRNYIKDFESKGVTCVLATSIYRRKFDESGKLKENCHLGFPEAMIEVSEELNVLCIDLTTLTKNKINELGPVASTSWFMMFGENVYDNYPEGKDDTTHLRSDGAFNVANMFVSEIKKTNHKLKELLK